MRKLYQHARSSRTSENMAAVSEGVQLGDVCNNWVSVIPLFAEFFTSSSTSTHTKFDQPKKLKTADHPKRRAFVNW